MPPIDPLAGPRFALSGRVATMNDQFRVHAKGVVYIDRGGIVAVKDADQPPPSGFEGVRPIASGGTLFPGLIELHNHLAYNALPLWDVPKRYTNRNQWGGIAEYRRRISGPMQVVGRSPGLLPAVVRYVECKNLFGGVTTSQGVELYSNRGARRYYRGLVRNVEQTDEADLPEAGTRVADVEAVDRDKFLGRIKRKRCYLLHLSEGVDDSAREHFLALRFPAGNWAIADSLVGIHCAGLRAADFDVMGDHHASMVWSPMSNLLLYGATADIKAARDSGVRIALGSDWSPSGSKNLLGELKVAKVVSDMAGGIFSDRQLVAMATRDAAAILGWSQHIGSLDTGRRADLVVVAGTSGDPYAQLIAATEHDLRLVVINGVPRFGNGTLMKKLGADGEVVKIGGRRRTVLLDQGTADPVVGELSYAEATETLDDAFSRLPELAKALEEGTPVISAASAGSMRLTARPQEVVWSLALDEIEETGLDLRPRILSRRGTRTGPSRVSEELSAMASAPLSTLLSPIDVDPATAVDDAGYLDRLDTQRNLPAAVKAGLRELWE
jgi:5-methylthioadenosine/S-adenosylhomocysteine deaminase